MGDDAGGPLTFWPSTRVRRLSDVTRLTATAAALAALGLLALLGRGVVDDVARLVPDAVSGVPRTLLSIANVVASLAVLGVVIAVSLDALRRRRFALTSAGLACLLALALAAGAEWVTDVAPAGGATSLLGSAEESAVLPVAAAVGIAVGADLQRRRRWLRLTRASLAVAIGCAVGLGSLTPFGAAVAVLIGTTAGLAVRVVAGVVPARPTEQVLRAALGRAGFEVTELVPGRQESGKAAYAASTDSRRLEITVVDPDRRGIPLVRRAGRILRLRTSAVGRPALTFRGQLEQQALSTGLAQAAGVRVPSVLALLAVDTALVLVEEPLSQTSLSDPPPEGRPAALAAAFRALRRFHDAGLAHGAITADVVVVLPDGTAGFRGLVGAQAAATELQRELDVVALLVAGGTLVGAPEAVLALQSGYRTQPATDTGLATLLQPLTLPRPLRTAVRPTPLLDDLRAELTDPGEIVAGAAPRLQRVRPRTVFSIAAATVAAHILATQLSQVGIMDALRQADLRWLAVALLGSAVTYIGAALTVQAFAPTPLPLTRTASVQLASSFLTLVTPPTVGHVGLNIRYLQRSGVPTATAGASVAVSQGVTVVVTVVGLLLCAWLSGVSASRLTLLPSGDVLAVLLGVAALLALAVAAPATRRILRRRLEPLIRQAVPQLAAAATDPRRLGTAVLGILVLNGGNVLALDASLRAFSTTLAVPALVVVFLAASTLGSAAPTPGGLGAVEAALVGGLTATGVALAPALTAVLAFRTATFWLPAPIGWVAFVALGRRGRI